VKVRDVSKRLTGEGWVLARTRGDHRHYKHDTKPGIVTVAGHPSKDIPPDTLKSIYRQAGWEDKP
jgi:predicted RNA binding protein YcfA (HicA-like mRNA interferase family)